MNKLDDIALNIELVLISIVEGVALSSLASITAPLLAGPNALSVLPFVLAGLSLLLVFWAQAILHAISFIRWPIHMGHMMLYFLAAFLQVIAYMNINNIIGWFFWWTVFSILVFIIYVVDLAVLESARSSFEDIPSGTAYIASVIRRHLYELAFLVPVSIAFNLGVLALLYFYPAFFATGPYAEILGIIQLLVSLGALWDCINNFKKRTALLPALFR